MDVWNIKRSRNRDLKRHLEFILKSYQIMAENRVNSYGFEVLYSTLIAEMKRRRIYTDFYERKYYIIKRNKDEFCYERA